MLIAANTGFSASIDDCGRVREQAPRHAESTLVAKVTRRDATVSIYERFGDTCFALPCGIICLIAAISGWRVK